MGETSGTEHHIPREEIAVAIVVRQGHVLVAKRRPQQQWGSFWEFPGGKIRSAEAPEEAVVREVHEETGQTVRVIRKLAVVDQRAPWALQQIHFFLAELSGANSIPETQTAGGSPEPQPESGGLSCTLPSKVAQLRFGEELLGNFRWVPISDLPSLEFPPANRSVIQTLLTELSETGTNPRESPDEPAIC